MTSIRKRLLLFILSILALATLAICIATYLGIRHEMDELYDANMRQLATTASGLIGENTLPVRPYSSNEWPKGEEVFLVQVWKDGVLEYSSHPAADFPLQNKKGHRRVEFRDEEWGFYQETINSHVIQVAQSLHVRHEVIHEVYNAIIIPILIQFPVVAFLVWFFVGYGFRPLSRISDLIQKRTADFMEPIAAENTPDEIRSLILALNDLLRRLKISLETQRQFTADAAHELRTPLTAVKLQLDLLQRAEKPDERIEAMNTLERGVDRSIRLVSQLLEMARQEPNAEMAEFSTFNLKSLVENTMHEQEPMARAKTIGITAETQDATIHADKASLAIMVGNLLGNAITYTNAGGHIFLKTYLAEGTPVFEIADDGIGISAADKPRIFDRFYRVMGTGTTGSGLGLSIVKTIADRHSIRIEVSDGIGGKGTSFRLIFPKP